MSNDSKLALVLGIVIVMLLGVVFFRTDTAVNAAPDGPAPAQIHSQATPK